MGIVPARLDPDGVEVVIPPRVDVVDPTELEDRVVDEGKKLVGSPELVLEVVMVEIELKVDAEVEVGMVILIVSKQARSGRTRMASFSCLKVEKLLQLSLRQTASI
jgi:hypothetical protein